MTKSKEDFDALVELAMSQGKIKNMRPVVEKELLHYDILFALDEAKLLDKLVFQGGTSLRLCRDSNRYSEDLNFAGGKNFNSKMLADIKHVIEKYIGNRYGLEVSVKEPSSLKQDPKYAELNIDKWQISVVTSPTQKHLPKQRVKLEVANIPAYTKEPLPLNSNYDFLPDGYSSTLIFTESLNEVMADKIISLPATQKYVRHRDVWDLVFLHRKGAKVDKNLVSKKIEDYKLDGFIDMLDNRIASLEQIVFGAPLSDEMKRFLPLDIFEATLATDKFKTYMLSTLTAILNEAKRSIVESTDSELDFPM
ncbi:nucleotidyl transferase AbiEii/AbiGii toxin family protein [Shewanella sp. 202IG2-18]|uniref:nucleotidyl transferase AbiEii/AbiGii toxin family protein n=1 Tax=Parashewanella hymeniacidonis TaxID=2807618 RepID=UPI001961686B|nr:nucleotidyl transferase AbiEii/AbiGii toxin family protein [Parashewanella hymeniacidonis]MBM7070746.1 nucleotidyl transferase AbiEii/AbiGii toxin family protein [Parashewanella hymeniacidonis]